MFSWYYIEGILIQSCYTLLIVLGLSILTGYTGMFSFGHAGFVCIGAYVSILCTMAFGLPYWLSLIIAGLAAMQDHPEPQGRLFLHRHARRGRGDTADL